MLFQIINKKKVTFGKEQNNHDYSFTKVQCPIDTITKLDEQSDIDHFGRDYLSIKM